jgi:Inositol polyphosphate kinase
MNHLLRVRSVWTLCVPCVHILHVTLACANLFLTTFCLFLTTLDHTLLLFAHSLTFCAPPHLFFFTLTHSHLIHASTSHPPTPNPHHSATPEKLESMREKDLGSTTHSVGVRVTGLKVWHAHPEPGFVRQTKSWGRQITKDTLPSSMRCFFHDGASLHADVVKESLCKLHTLREWMSAQRRLRFFSSSLLFVYDGEHPQEVRLRMIDFAHVFKIKDNGCDEGYLTGLNNLINILTAYL